MIGIWVGSTSLAIMNNATYQHLCTSFCMGIFFIVLESISKGGVAESYKICKSSFGSDF